MSAQLYQRRVKEVMSKELVTLDVSSTMHEALQVMIENKVSALPVVDHQGSCVGILSTRDMVDVTRELDEGLQTLEREIDSGSAAFFRNLSENAAQQSVMDFMTEDVVAVEPETLLVQAASQMLRERIHRLPVLDADRRLVGILSMSDVLQAFVDGAPEP